MCHHHYVVLRSSLKEGPSDTRLRAPQDGTCRECCSVYQVLLHKGNTLACGLGFSQPAACTAIYNAITCPIKYPVQMKSCVPLPPFDAVNLRVKMKDESQAALFPSLYCIQTKIICHLLLLSPPIGNRTNDACLIFYSEKTATNKRVGRWNETFCLCCVKLGLPLKVITRLRHTPSK